MTEFISGVLVGFGLVLFKDYHVGRREKKKVRVEFFLTDGTFFEHDLTIYVPEFKTAGDVITSKYLGKMWNEAIKTPRGFTTYKTGYVEAFKIL